MKGIILHGGHGTRLKPLTHTSPKQLLPIGNKPMSQYALEDLKTVGITEIGIIIGDVFPEKIKEYYGDGSNFGVKLSYIYQDSPKGIAHAIKLCKEFIGNEKFIVYLGDNILRKDLKEYTEKFKTSDSDAMILLCEVEDPERFGIAELDKDDPNKIKKILEKPKNPTSNLAVIGIYFLTPKIFDIIDSLKPSWRNEFEITDALDMLIKNGDRVEYDTITGWWKDTGTPEDIIHANKLILDSIGTKDQFLINRDSKIENQIIIGKNTSISPENIIIGPAIIGDNCTLDSTKIGPHVSIGDSCTIKKCEIKNSIIMRDCEIDIEIEIYDSIIANGTKITNAKELKKCQFLLGERSQINI